MLKFSSTFSILFVALSATTALAKANSWILADDAGVQRVVAGAQKALVSSDMRCQFGSVAITRSLRETQIVQRLSSAVVAEGGDEQTLFRTVKFTLPIEGGNVGDKELVYVTINTETGVADSLKIEFQQKFQPLSGLSVFCR